VGAELPRRILENAADAMVRFLPGAPWQGLRPMALAREALTAAAPIVEALCHWTLESAETHEEFHFGNPCPYAVVAAVLRGEADRREGRPGSTLVADLRAQLAELGRSALRAQASGAEERDHLRERLTAQRRELAALQRTLNRLRDSAPAEPTPEEAARATELHEAFIAAVRERAAAGDVEWLAEHLIGKDAKHVATIARLENQREALRGANRLRRERNGQAERANRLEAELKANRTPAGGDSPPPGPSVKES
jgi:hypothetical protein